MVGRCRRSAPWLIAILALATLACSSPSENEAARYRTAGLVLDEGGQPRLCFSYADSIPPQCDGSPLEDWDWNAVDHQAAGSARWGTYEFDVVCDTDRYTYRLASSAVPLTVVAVGVGPSRPSCF